MLGTRALWLGPPEAGEIHCVTAGDRIIYGVTNNVAEEKSLMEQN
jgi:hypothetical protein